MGYVQIADDVREIIERHVAVGRAGSEADFVAEAVRLYADYLHSEAAIAAMVGRADADMAAGRHVTVSTPADAEALHRRMMDRLHAGLADPASRG